MSSDGIASFYDRLRSYVPRCHDRPRWYSKGVQPNQHSPGSSHARHIWRGDLLQSGQWMADGTTNPKDSFGWIRWNIEADDACSIRGDGCQVGKRFLELELPHHSHDPLDRDRLPGFRSREVFEVPSNAKGILESRYAFTEWSQIAVQTHHRVSRNRLSLGNQPYVRRHNQTPRSRRIRLAGS